MEQLIAELKAKSLYIKTLNRHLFFSWDLFANSKRHGITVDAHALMDRSRNLSEVVKMVYLCIVKYYETAQALGLECPTPIDIHELEAWMSLRPDEATEAMQYITGQIYEQSKKKAPTERRSQSVSSVSQPPSNRMPGRWKRFWRGNAKGDSTSGN